MWDDTFVRYHEPHIGIAAVKVLEAAGFEVALVRQRKCCGRPAFSQGNLEALMKSGQVWASGVQDIGKQMAASAQSSFDETLSTFKALSSVKSFKDAFDLQSNRTRAIALASRAAMPAKVAGSVSERKRTG